MEDINNNLQVEQTEGPGLLEFNFKTIYKIVILHWSWFLLSTIICVSVAMIYLRYATPIYSSWGKLLIRDEENVRYNRNNMMYNTSLGTVFNSAGIDNELEILKSRALAEEAVRDLKLNIVYTTPGRVTDHIAYLTQPIDVTMDSLILEELKSSVNLEIKRKGGAYLVTGKYYVPKLDSSIETEINERFEKLPFTLTTKIGNIYFTQNDHRVLRDGGVEKVWMMSPRAKSYSYAGRIKAEATSKMTSIALITINDEVRQRGVDYLKQLAICYNRQANDDKNEVAMRTEVFINERLLKLQNELGTTEGNIESYKREQELIEPRVNSNISLQGSNQYKQKLVEAEVQLELLNSIAAFVRQPENKYQALPDNFGLNDNVANGIISKYNEIALQRNRLLRSASEKSPVVIKLTNQLDELEGALKRSLVQLKKQLTVERNAVKGQLNDFTGAVRKAPTQEKVLAQISRQQEVMSGLYLMLLQKREENSISLAATATKGRLIDEPVSGGMISPKRNMIMMGALFLGLLLPFIFFYLREFFRYRIEAHEEVEKLTKLPIIADVAVSSESAKTKADIVVHENQNSTMEEIFRSMRTNLQFMLKDDEKVILFTSTTSGEGKTFNAANCAMSFALLDKKVILVGLDIRKPRLVELFQLNDRQHGLTPLLRHTLPTWEEVQANILSSGVNKNLDILASGPIPPNPSELVARPSLDHIFELLKEHYDYIIIDSAPVGLVTDTLQLGRVANATVYMCRADFTPRDSFHLINTLSEEKKLPNVAIVINGIDMSKKKYGYYYGYGRYGKYGRYGRYGGYGKYGKYGKYGSYGSYGSYGAYGNSQYGNKHDSSVKIK